MSGKPDQADVRYARQYSETAKADGDPLRIAELYGPEEFWDQSTRQMVDALRRNHAADIHPPTSAARSTACPHCDGEGCQWCRQSTGTTDE